MQTSSVVSRSVEKRETLGSGLPWVPGAAALRRWARGAYASVAYGQRPRAGAPLICIRVVGTAESRRLNRSFRGKDAPTNVLSFPTGTPGLAGGPLGDIAVALGVVRREARGQGRSLRAHLAHLVAHGALHLAGHDHGRAGEARRMERAEARIMRRLALPNPWRGVA